MSDAWAILLVTASSYIPYLLLRASLGAVAPADVAVAPAASVALFAWVGMATSAVQVRFSPLSVAGLLVVLCVAILAVRAVLARRSGRWISPPRRTVPRSARPVVRPAVAGLVVAGALGLSSWASSPSWISGIPGSPDDVWHGYLTAFIARSGVASPSRLAPVDPVSGQPVDGYPYGFHLLASLSVGGTDVAHAMNALIVVGAVVVAAVGMAALAREVFGYDPWAIALAPVVLALTGTYLVRLVGIPAYALGLALLPGVLAAVLRAVRCDWAPGPALGAVLGVTGMVVVQPASVFSLAVVAAPFLVWRGMRWLRHGSWRRRPRSAERRFVISGVALLLVAGPWILLAASKSGSSLAVMRPVKAELVEAWLRTVVLDEPVGGVPLVLGIVSLVGLVLAVAGRLPRWLGFSWLLSVALYTVAAAGSDDVRRAATGAWFGDWFRLAAVTAVVAALLVAGALSWFATLVARRSRTLSVAVPLVVVVLASVLAIPGYRDFTANATSSSVVTASGRTAYAWVAEHAKPGERVLNNWVDGSTWGYSLYGMPVAVPYVNTLTLIPSRAYVLRHLPLLGSNPAVDRGLQRMNARWAVVHFGAVPLGGTPVVLPVGSPYVHEVFRSGAEAVYEIDLAGLPT